MTDPFEHHATGFDTPAAGAFSITPSDNTVLATTPRALYVGTGGSLAVQMKAGETVSFENLPDGALLPIRVVKVLAATSASSILGLY